MLLLSVFGGYLFSELINGMNESCLQRATKMLVMERSLADATIALGREIQEWKDMLLRINDTELYKKHRKAFTDASADVRAALMRTETAMQNEGMNTGEIDQLIGEHQALESDYTFGKIGLKSQDIDSLVETDKLVIGVDRKLQLHFANVRAEIQNFSNQQLKELTLTLGKRYLLGLLGTFLLFIMPLAGCIFLLFSRYRIVRE